MIRQAQAELRLLVRSLVLPVVIILCALGDVAHVASAAGAVRSHYATFEHTRSGYAALVTSLVEIAPTSSVSETLKIFGFLVYPALFFLLGLWLATGQRRHRLEKVTLVRAGTARTTAARQLALLVAAALVIAVTLLVDRVSRGVAQSALYVELPLHAFVPLAPLPQQNGLAQWAAILLMTVFFGAAGIVVGAFAGVFAIPAIAFVLIDFLAPILGRNDPRNWFLVLARGAFDYAGSPTLASPVPVPIVVAAVAAAVSALAFIALGYLGIRIRNPRAT